MLAFGYRMLNVSKQKIQWLLHEIYLATAVVDGLCSDTSHENGREAVDGPPSKLPRLHPFRKHWVGKDHPSLGPSLRIPSNLSARIHPNIILKRAWFTCVTIDDVGIHVILVYSQYKARKRLRAEGKAVTKEYQCSRQRRLKW